MGGVWGSKVAEGASDVLRPWKAAVMLETA